MPSSNPTLTSIVLTDPTTTSASVVHYTITFSEAVSTPQISDFFLEASSTLKGASVQSVTAVPGSGGKSYTVAVATGTGQGSLALEVVGASITDTSGNHFQGTFVGDGTYATGNQPGAVAIADVNNDGIADLVVSNLHSSVQNANGTYGAGTVSVY